MAKTTYSREELELQLSESHREFWAADATINNLELKIADMAAQLANAEKRIAELESLAAPKIPPLAALTVPDERAAFETFMEKRFKDCIDRRMVKNGDGEYFAWDMQVAWIVWQGRAAIPQGSEPETDNTNQQFESLSRGDK